MVVAENRLNQSFEVESVNRVWVGDITFISTAAGLALSLGIVGFLFRRVVGWAMSERLDQQLVIKALQMAILRCRPEPGLITDQGRQYSGAVYVNLLKTYGMLQSMSRRGNCYDNAVAESFFSSLKNELVYHCNFKTRDEARAAAVCQ